MDTQKTLEIPLTQVEGSSQVLGIGYDSATQTLAVRFNSGVYQYHDVPPATHRAFLEAESKGKFLGANVKPHYAFTKVG